MNKNKRYLQLETLFATYPYLKRKGATVTWRRVTAGPVTDRDIANIKNGVEPDKRTLVYEDTVITKEPISGG